MGGFSVSSASAITPGSRPTFSEDSKALNCRFSNPSLRHLSDLAYLAGEFRLRPALSPTPMAMVAPLS